MTDLEYYLWGEVSRLEKENKRLKSGEVMQNLRAEYESELRKKDARIRQLTIERDEYSFSRKEITRRWFEVIEDMEKEHAKEIKNKDKIIAEQQDTICRQEKRYADLEEKYKEALSRYYEKGTELEEAQGLIVKLTAQVNHDYENSSLPSSKCINRKKITNNREKTGKKPGAQVGHPHHPRKKLKPDEIKKVPTNEIFMDDKRYKRTGNIIKKQVIGISVTPVVIEYQADEFYDKDRGKYVHSSFPDVAKDDVNYDDSMKAFLFMLNSRCNVSLEKTAQFVSDITDGALKPSVGMINGLCKEFSLKSKPEQDELFKKLLDAPVMHVDGTTARVNGSNNTVIVCSNGAATMYFARENKGHEGVKGTPVETFGGILIHDHEATFFSYGSDHQDCLVHIERYLKDSIENEKDLTWNQEMLDLIKEMIHENNISPDGVSDQKIAEFEARYDAIVQKAGEEYTDNPPSKYYKDGYNLYQRMIKYKHNHLLFLSNPLVDPDNNLCERKARILKGKINQAISLRSQDHLTDYCDCLSVIDHFATDDDVNLYKAIKYIFKRPRIKISKVKSP